MGSLDNLELQSLFSAVDPRQLFLDFLSFSEGPGWPALPDGRESLLDMLLSKDFLTTCGTAILPLAACLRGSSTAAMEEASHAMRCVSAIARLAECAPPAAHDDATHEEVSAAHEVLKEIQTMCFLEAAPGQQQGPLQAVLANLYQHGKQQGVYAGLDACLSVLSVLALTREHQVSLMII